MFRAVVIARDASRARYLREQPTLLS
jgi:hypothetical protein